MMVNSIYFVTLNLNGTLVNKIYKSIYVVKMCFGRVFMHDLMAFWFFLTAMNVKKHYFE